MMTKLSFARIGVSIFLIGYFHFISISQYSPENFVRYTSKDGLSDNYVLAIEQDSLGFLWIATENGLNRFDGYTFTNYLFDSSEGFLASSILKKIKLFNQHELGIISYGGFQVLDPLTMQVRDFIIPDTTAFFGLRNYAIDAVRLKNGQYAVTTTSGYYVWNHDGTLDFRYDAYDMKDVGIQDIRYGRQIFQPGNDILVYNESRGLAHYDVPGKVYTKVDSSFTEWIPFMHPAVGGAFHWTTKSQVGENEFVFLSVLDSLIYYNSATKRRVGSPLPFHWEKDFSWFSRIIPFDDSTLAITSEYEGVYFLTLNRRTGQIIFDNQKYLPDYKVLSLFKDRENRLWVGTSKGLLRQIINTPLIEKFEWPDPSGRSEGFTDAIIHNGILYISRQNPLSGLVAVDLNSMKIMKEFNFYGIGKMNIINSIKMYYPDTLWLGTDQELIWFDTKSWNYGKVRNAIRSQQEVIRLNTLASERKDGNAWMLLQLSGSVARYDIQSRTFQFFDETSDPVLPFTLVKHIAYDAYGNVWIGGHALARWNHASMHFDTIMRLYGGTKNYNTDILTMVADNAGSLWLHNAENGLLQYNIRDKVFRQFSMKDGLPSNTIIGLSPVIGGILFMTMPHHLIRMDTKNYGIEVFANESDLPEEISSGRSMYWHEEGQRMYAFYRNAIIRFPLVRPPSNFEGNDIIVQELEINDKNKLYYPADNTKLEARENNLSIYYTIIDFEQSNDYQFAYHFDDSKEWTNVASQRVVHLTDLTSGDHQLQIKATGKSGKQKVSIFYFSIKRPFWKQAWFIALTAVLFSGIIYWIFRVRESQIKEKANLDNQIAMAEMKALHAQMNPHFIFNSLNSIKEMVLQNEIKDASRYLSDFAHLIRMTLDQSRQTFVSLRSTMEYLTWYVKMEQLRNSNFDFQMQADPSLDPDDTLIPPMLIQPFIENAIWHGVGASKKAIHVKVLFNKRDDQLVCAIEDDGIGIDKSREKKNGLNSSHQSVGIHNIEKRIDLLNQKHHLKSSIRITDKHAEGMGQITGTIVSIILPLEIQEIK